MSQFKLFKIYFKSGQILLCVMRLGALALFDVETLGWCKTNYSQLWLSC